MKDRKKVYEFNLGRVKTKIVRVLKQRRNESTVADLISATALPKFQVEQAVKVVADEYRGHLRVTEFGDIFYYFPYGMRSTVRGFGPRFKHLVRAILKAVGRFFSVFFKVWIMVMLIGYFLLFVGILILAVVASIAASLSGRGGSRRTSSGGGLFSLFFVMRVFQIFAWIWLSSGTGSYRQRRLRGRIRGQGRLLHRSAFAYVFGEEDLNKDWQEKEKRYISRFIRGRKGVLTREELMVITGRNPEQTQQLLNQLLVEWEGEPSVTENGTLVYLFPELLRSREAELEGDSRLPLLNPDRKSPHPFNNNPKKTNRWIGFFNTFNILFSGYFLYLGAVNPAPVYEIVKRALRLKVDFAYLYHLVHGFLESIGVQTPASLIWIALGAVPLIFSLLFFLIPVIRRAFQKKQNELIKQENFRKNIHFHVLGNTDLVDPKDISPYAPEETPSKAEAFKQSVLDELTAAVSGNVEAAEDGHTVYHFPVLGRELRDVRTYRTAIDLSDSLPGKTVFDTGKKDY